MNWINRLLFAALTLLALFLLLQIHHPFLPITVDRLPFLMELVLLDYAGFTEASSLLAVVYTHNTHVLLTAQLDFTINTDLDVRLMCVVYHSFI